MVGSGLCIWDDTPRGREEEEEEKRKRREGKGEQGKRKSREGRVVISLPAPFDICVCIDNLSNGTGYPGGVKAAVRPRATSTKIF